MSLFTLQPQYSSEVFHLSADATLEAAIPIQMQTCKANRKNRSESITQPDIGNKSDEEVLSSTRLEGSVQGEWYSTTHIFD
jgi:hypothetical protein